MAWRRHVSRAGLVLSAGLACASVVGLAQNPFLVPFAALGAEAARAAIDRAIDATVDEGWISAELARAVAADDADRTDSMLALAAERDIPVPPDLAAAAAAQGSLRNTILSCGACAWDPMQCRGARELAVCALPVELTPLGDINALRRQAAVAMAGGEVDRLEAGLAAAGLASTVIVAGIGVKTGATLVRVARRADRLSPAFVRRLGRAADLEIAWSRVDDLVLRRVELPEVLNLRRLERLSGIAGDVARVIAHTSMEDALALLPRIDGPEELRRLARLSEVAGETTRPAVETLGLSRAIRTVTLVTDAVLGVVAGLTGVIGYLAGLLMSRAIRRLSRTRPQGLDCGQTPGSPTCREEGR
jgi:hypothetical protein